jgi:hypothetical protein
MPPNVRHNASRGMGMGRMDLKTRLSQPWVIWVLFASFVGIYGVLILAEAYTDRFAWLPLAEAAILLLFFDTLHLGWRRQDEITAKPLSFVLPGYRESFRRSGLLRAVRWGVVGSLWLFSSAWSRLLWYWRFAQIWSDCPSGIPSDVSLSLKPSILDIPLSVAGGFFLGMAASLWWTYFLFVRFRSRSLNVLFKVFGLALIVVLAGSKVSQRTFIFWSIFIPMSALYCAYFWVRLGDHDWVKNRHREMIVDEIDGFRRFAAEWESPAWVEKLFLSRMERGDAGAGGHHIWGCLYRSFGPMLARWRRIAVALLIGLLVQGYMSRALAELVFLIFGVLMAYCVLPVESTMLLPEGRRHTYRLSIVVAAVATMLLLATVVVMIALSWVLAALVPPISWGTYRWQYVGIRIGSLLLACLPVPWAFLLRRIWLHVLGLCVVILIIGIIVTFFPLREGARWHHFLHAGRMPLVILIGCGWALFLSSAWIKHRWGDLSGQQPIRNY